MALRLKSRPLPLILLASIALVAALVLVALPQETASAHKPLFPDRAIATPAQAWRIPDPTVSWAVYAQLDHPGAAQWYVFAATPNLALDAQITIPAVAAERQFAPHLALVGPGLPTPSGTATALAIPAGLGVQVLDATHAGTTDQFNEPFTQTTYWNRQDLKETLAQGGTYYLAVFSAPTDQPATGKYVLAVGDREEFGAGDLVTFPWTYVRVRAFAEAGVPLWFWVVLGIIAVVVVLRVRLRSQRRHAASSPSPALTGNGGATTTP